MDHIGAWRGKKLATDGTHVVIVLRTVGTAANKAENRLAGKERQYPPPTAESPG